MKEIAINGKIYKIPNGLNDFQQKMYVHLINWKWKNISIQSGNAQGHPYDAILPEEIVERKEWPHIYPDIQKALKAHRVKNDFRIHQHFYHMASSQAANINLFLPILHHPAVNSILGAIKTDFASLATDCLDNGYCIEFWGKNFDPVSIGPDNKGLLGDKSKMAGTDSDIAIAYRNLQGELCLWLIEHKLTEKEFTECGGYKSKGRQARHDCSKSFTQLLEAPQSCYYKDVRKFKYWEITDANRAFFANHSPHASCPFRGGMNQLWRNQLLALSIEQESSQPYKHVHFSVVRHLDNHHLDNTLAAYKELVADKAKFSVFTSADFLSAAKQQCDTGLDKWIAWYNGLYRL
jgi:hypothetical protein